MSRGEVDTAHAAADPAHGPNLGFAKAQRLALAAQEHDVAIAIGDRRAHEHIALFEHEGAQARRARRETREVRFLHVAPGRGHEDEAILRLRVHGQDRGDALALVELQQIHHRPPAGRAARHRYLVDLDPVHLAEIGETQQRVVGVGDQQVLDKILVFDAQRRLAHTAAALHLILGQRLGFRVAAVGERDHAVLGGDQVLGGEVFLGVANFRSARVAELLGDLLQFLADNLQQAFGVGEDIQQIGDLGQLVLVLLEQFFVLQTGKAMQAQIENGLGLGRRQAVAAVAQAEGEVQIIGATGRGAGALQHRRHLAGKPALCQQALAGFGGAGRRLDQFDNAIDVRQRDGQALERVPALARPAQQVHGAPGDDLAPVAQKRFENLLEIENLRLALDQRHHVDAEDALQGRLRIQVVEHHVAHFAPAQFDNDTQAVLVRLIAQLADALELFLFDQFGNALNQARFVQLVGYFVDDDRVATGALIRDDFRLGAHVDTPATGAVGLHDAGASIDDRRRGEVGPRQVAHQVIDAALGRTDQRQAGVDHLAKIVRRDIRRHAHGDTRGTVDQQIGRPGRQHLGNLLRAVVVVDEIDGLLVEIGQQRMGDLGHANFRVAHRRGGIAVDGTEVALAIDEGVTHGEGLRHAHDGVVHRRVAVGVILADHVADHPGGFLVGLVPVVVEFVHGEQHTPVHGLEAVADIGQGAAHDDAHGVVEIGLLEFVLNGDGRDLPG